MKILQLITSNQLRGAEVFAAQLSDELTALGHEVVLAHLLGREQALPKNPRVRQVDLGGVDARAPISISAWRNLRRLISEFQPDIVQANGSETLKYAAILRLVDRRLPLIYRNISVMSMWSGDGAKKRMVGTALRAMSRVVSVTRVGEDDLVAGFGLEPAKVCVIPIGVPLPEVWTDDERLAARREDRSALGLPADCPLIVHAGSFTPEKNHCQLLEAFAGVRAKLPDARLFLLGDGPLRPEIEAAVDALGMRPYVRFAGAVPNASSVIALADVLVLPSLREGLPGVILEAGAAKVPAVAYNIGGVSEIIEDGVSGLLIEHGDVEGLAGGLVHVLSDSVFRDGLGDQARATVQERYDLAAVAREFEGLYLSVAQVAGD